MHLYADIGKPHCFWWLGHIHSELIKLISKFMPRSELGILLSLEGKESIKFYYWPHISLYTICAKMDG